MVTETEKEELKRARDKGVAWLGLNHPDWRNKVSKDALDVGSEEMCILGQIDGCCFDCFLETNAKDYDWAAGHGFYIASFDGSYFEPRYEVLTELWKEIL